MSTVRIQIRRGTAADWTAANPTLAAGEVGYDTTSSKMKVGDGSTAWNTLAYVSSDAPAIGEIAQDAINTALTMGSGLSKTYDDAGNTITINVDSAVVATLNGTQTLVNKTLSSPVVNSPTGILKSDVGLGNVDNTSDQNKPVSTAQAAAIGAVSNAIQNTAMDYVGDHTTGGDGITTAYNSTTNALTITANVAAQNGVQKNTDNTGLITFSLADNITISGAMTSNSLTTGALSATAITGSSLTLSGDLTVGGNVNQVNSTVLNVTDSMVYLAEDNTTNVVDLGVVASYTKDSVYQHTGLVRDASENTWKLFTGVAAEPTTTVNFTGATYDNLLLGHIESTSANIGDVSNAELQHLNGVTSAIQTQIDAKLASATAATTYAPIAGATLTGTVTLPNTTSIGMVSSTELGYLDGVTSAIQTQLDLKAPKDSPTFTGTVTLPNNTIQQQHLGDDSVGTNELGGLAVTTAKIADLAITTAKLSDTSVTNAKLAGSIGWDKLSVSATVSDAELGYLDGVTSAVQTQIDAKASSSTVTSHTSATTNVHGIADTAALATTTQVATAKSEAIAAVTKTSLGLENVNNTSDANKPISSATQTALDLKASLASPALTGVPTAPTAAAATNTTQVATTAYVRGEVAALVNSAGSTLDTLGEIATALGNDANLSATLTTSIGLKAPIASPTFTGTVTVAANGIAFTDGTQTKEGVASRTPIVQKTAAYTLSALTERDSLIEVSSATAVVVTVPTNATVAYPVGTSIDILQTSTGQVSIAGAAGVTVNATPGLKLRTQWSGATLFKRATDTWVLYGDLSA